MCHRCMHQCTTYLARTYNPTLGHMVGGSTVESVEMVEFHTQHTVNACNCICYVCRCNQRQTDRVHFIFSQFFNSKICILVLPTMPYVACVTCTVNSSPIAMIVKWNGLFHTKGRLYNIFYFSDLAIRSYCICGEIHANASSTTATTTLQR